MAHMSAPGAATGTTTRPDESMSLLTQLTERSLDEGYAEATARRGTEAPARTGVLLTVGFVAVGLLLATAGVQARNREAAIAQGRQALIEKIEERSSRADTLTGDVARLRASVAKARQDRLRLTAEGERLARQLIALEVATGAAPVVGPGLVIRLDDAPEPEPAQDEQNPRTSNELSEGRVTDRDLQTIVNEIWLAGAEAVAINDQRLTSLSAIRSAGPNVLVAFRPLTPPYEVVAVGDAPWMHRKVVSGFAGSYLDVLGNYGIRHSVKTRDSLRLPSSGGLTLRHATVPHRGDGAVPGAGDAAVPGGGGGG